MCCGTCKAWAAAPATPRWSPRVFTMADVSHTSVSDCSKSRSSCKVAASVAVGECSAEGSCYLHRGAAGDGRLENAMMAQGIVVTAPECYVATHLTHRLSEYSRTALPCVFRAAAAAAAAAAASAASAAPPPPPAAVIFKKKGWPMSRSGCQHVQESGSQRIVPRPTDEPLETIPKCSAEFSASQAPES